MQTIDSRSIAFPSSLRAKLPALLAAGVLFGFASCATTPAQRVILNEIKGCPVYEEEVAFPTLYQEQAVAAGGKVEPVVEPEPEEVVENDLDRVYKTVREEFEDSNLKLEEIANGFREQGLSVEKKVGPDGKVTRELVISIDGDVSFAHGSSKLTNRAARLVEKVGKAMAQYPNAKARIGGHTDSTGPFRVNKWLSLERARSVEKALKTKHKLSDSQIIEVKGYADTRKIVDTMKSEPRNRRVEIRVSLD